MATHSSVLAWRIPGTEEPGGLPSMGSHRVGHYWSDLAAAAAGNQKGRGAENKDLSIYDGSPHLQQKWLSGTLICVGCSRLHKGPARYRDWKAEIPREAAERHVFTAWVPNLPQTPWGALDESSQVYCPWVSWFLFYRLNQFNDEVSELSPCLDPIPFAPPQPSSFWKLEFLKTRKLEKQYFKIGSHAWDPL